MTTQKIQIHWPHEKEKETFFECIWDFTTENQITYEKEKCWNTTFRNKRGGARRAKYAMNDRAIIRAHIN